MSKSDNVITLQRLAAYSMLLVQGPGSEVWLQNEPDDIRAAFLAMRPLQLNLGGTDFWPELIEFQVDVQTALKQGKPVSLDMLERHGFYGQFAFWFWSKIHELGETGFFSKPTGHYKVDLIRNFGRDDITAGWMITFTESSLHHLYHNVIRSREEVCRVLKQTKPDTPVFPYLLHFVKTKPVEFLE